MSSDGRGGVKEITYDNGVSWHNRGRSVWIWRKKGGQAWHFDTVVYEDEIKEKMRRLKEANPGLKFKAVDMFGQPYEKRRR